jgi:hypothetical protein
MQAIDDLLRQIPAFKEKIPMKVRVCTLFLFILVFQLSGGLYMASAHELVGGKALMHEDILMAIEASFLGMCVVFPILFRLKFRFVSRNIFTAVACGLIVCNLICMQVNSLPVLVVVCFIAGVLKMWGTFECFSSVQLSITPTRNLSVFFPVLYGMIFGCIELSGLSTVYISYFSDWRFVHYFIIGILLLVILLSRLLMRPFYLDKPLPLHGIDWLGGLLWSVVSLLLIFICLYGDHYDWLDSPHIRLAWFGVLFLGLFNYFRMKRIRTPWIEPRIFRYPHIFTILFLFMSVCVFTATATVLENSYTGGILRYDSLNAISLNWAKLAGLVAGGLFTWQACVRFHIRYKIIVFVGFALLLAYQIAFYFLISPDTNIELFYLPVALKSAGIVTLYSVLTLYAAQVVPFQNLFQVLCVFGFIREGVGPPLVTAFVERILKVSLQTNYLGLSGELDAQNSIANHLPLDALYGELQRQSLLVSIKEGFGYAIFFGILLLIATICTKYPTIHKYIRMPVFSLPRRLAEINIFRRPQYTAKELIENKEK